MKNKKTYTSWFAEKRGRWWVSYIDNETGKTVSMHRARFMAECMWGKLGKGQVAHHINGVKTDDRIENIEVMLSSDHTKEHNDERLKGRSCVRCGGAYRIFKANINPSKLCPKCRKSDRTIIENEKRAKSGYWKKRYWSQKLSRGKR